MKRTAVRIVPILVLLGIVTASAGGAAAGGPVLRLQKKSLKAVTAGARTAMSPLLMIVV